ncbi:MAG: DUF2277 domain-containing protein [bacterium]|nr:DUF2277 domain-containing protein [bacterium]
MCRNIRPLYNFAPAATEDEVRAAAVQFVRKVSGFTRPSAVNEGPFARAVESITASTHQLLAELATTAPQRDRDIEAARAKARAAQRYAPRANPV